MKIQGKVQRRQAITTTVLAIAIIVGIVSSGVAQETRIISFSPPATLSWTNSQTNAYYVIEYKWDWGYDWTAAWDPALNMVTTSEVSTAHADEYIQAITSQLWPILKINPPLIYRVVCSTEPLPSRYVTNEYMLINASTSTLTAFSMGYQPTIGSRTQITNLIDLAPGSSTPYYPFHEVFPSSGAMSGLHGVFFNFMQSGEHRDHIMSFFWWGPPEKRLQVVVSNDSYTVGCEWLNLRGTMPLRSVPE